MFGSELLEQLGMDEAGPVADVVGEDGLAVLVSRSHRMKEPSEWEVATQSPAW